MRHTIPALALVTATFVAACDTTTTQRRVETPAITSAPDGPLYARDGSVVAVPPRGTARVDPEPKRDIGDHEGSRMTLLELYQKAMEDKNAAAIQIENMQAAMAEEQKVAAQAAEERALLRAEITKLTRERDAARAESVDLAARLTTAQIARLEAEKTLLEVQIANRQREDAASAAQASAPAPEREGRPSRRRSSGQDTPADGGEKPASSGDHREGGH